MIYPFVEEHTCWDMRVKLLCTDFRDWHWNSFDRLRAEFGVEAAIHFKANFMIDFRDRLPRGGGLLFDLGANVGYMTSLFALWMGPHSRIVAVESHPGNCTKINLHALLNGLGNVATISKAVLDEVREKIHFRGEAMSDVLESDSFMCNSTTIDTLAAEYGIPDAIKIDIEGCELFALRGAKEVLAARKTVWAIEVHDWPAENAASLLRFGHTAQEVFDTMRDAGYVASVDERPIIKPVPASVLFCPE